MSLPFLNTAPGYDEELRNSVFFERGLHATSICGAVGAAVAVAMLQGQDEAGIASAAGIAANNLQIKWLVPLQAEAILAILSTSKKVIMVENNYSGQFARYLRSETGIVADGHIRKYDGEPFMPHHIVDGVTAILAGSTKPYVPVHEIQV